MTCTVIIGLGGGFRQLSGGEERGSIKMVLSLNPLFVLLSGFRTDSIYKLGNDPMCGVTTGGNDECHWDCKLGFNSWVTIFSKYRCKCIAK